MTTEIDNLRATIDNLRAGRDQHRKTLKALERALALAERQERSHRGSQSWIAYFALPALRESIESHRKAIAEADDALSRAVWAEFQAERAAAGLAA